MRIDTLVDALAHAPADRPFIRRWFDRDEIASVTFGEFREMASGHASYLKANGASAERPVVLMLPQGIDLMAAFAGAMMIGAAPAILAYPHRKLDPAKFASGLRGVTKNLNASAIVIDHEFPAELRVDLAHDPAVRLVELNANDVRAAAEREPLIVDRPATSIAFIQHSAGTTGLQKGVALSHQAVLTQLAHLADALQITGTDRVYTWLPLYHDMGLIACFMLPMVYHLPIVLQDPLEWVMQPAMMLEALSSECCTLAWLPNFALQVLARRVRPEDRAGLDLSRVRAIVNCSETVRASSIDEFLEAYAAAGLRPHAVQASYAMAETTFAVTQTTLNRPPHRVWVDRSVLHAEGIAVAAQPSSDGALCLVSSGTCLGGTAIRVVDAGGRDVSDGHVGELEVRSDSLFSGYYNRPDLTDAALRDGWYRTGDLGLVMAGEYFVIGRKRDLIVTAGTNIYPEDVEALTCSHPAIHDGRAIAIGVYNADLGTQEIVVAAEVDHLALMDQATTIAREIRQQINAEFGVSVRGVFVKPPRWIVKSSAGKPARSDTRARLFQEHPELAPKEEGC